jgi:hypothetical protein
MLNGESCWSVILLVDFTVQLLVDNEVAPGAVKAAPWELVWLASCSDRHSKMPTIPAPFDVLMTGEKVWLPATHLHPPMPVDDSAVKQWELT